MGLLSGTKRINRDGVDPMPGLLTTSAPMMSVGSMAPTNGTLYTFQPVTTSIENGTQDYTIPYNFATDPSLGGMATTLQDYATREGSQPPPIDAAQYMSMVQGDLANRGLTLNQIDENALIGSQMKHPGTYSYLVDSSGKIAATPQFMADTSVADGQAWLRLAASAALGGYMGGGEGGLSGMDLAADGGSNALWQTGSTGMSGMDMAADGLASGANSYGTGPQFDQWAQQLAQGTPTEVVNAADATSQLQNTLPQTSAPLESLQSMPQVDMPPLQEVAQVPNQLPNIDPKLLAPLAQQAMPKDDSSNYSNEGNNYPTTDSTQGSGGSPANASMDWQNSLKEWGGSIADWMKQNPNYAKLLFGALGATAATTGSKGGGGYIDSGYRPTISRGNWTPTATPNLTQRPQQPGLLNVPTTGQQNDGLWRFGLLGK